MELRHALEEERRYTALFTENRIPIGLALLRETDLTKLLEMRDWASRLAFYGARAVADAPGMV